MTDKVAATSLSETDMAFVDQAAMLFPIPGGLAFAVLSGTNDEINAVVNHFHDGVGDAALNFRYRDYVTHYAGPCLAVTQEVCKAFCDKMAATPKTLFDRMMSMVGRDRQSRYSKLYAAYLAR